VSRVAGFALLICVALMGSTAHAADRMQPGQWAFTTTTDGVSRSFKQCVNAEEALSANGDTKTARAAAEKKAGASSCVIKAYDVNGATVTYTIECRGSLIESTQTYHGDSSEGILKSTRAGKKATTAVKGRRIGAC